VASSEWVLFLNGSYGVGKSSALEHVGDLLAEERTPFSLMDVDWFHRSWPPAASDPDNVLTEADNMAAVWANYRSAGLRQLVVSGIIGSAADRHRYESAFGLTVRSVRLTASDAVVQARLRARYGASRVSALGWHLPRHAALAGELARADLDEVAIDTDALRPRDVARRVLQHVGLL
jgi:chloramphenicol 3-O-phosphotransferase